MVDYLGAHARMCVYVLLVMCAACEGKKKTLTPLVLALHMLVATKWELELN